MNHKISLYFFLSKFDLFGNYLQQRIKKEMFSTKSSLTCFSGGCGLCSRCSGGTVGNYAYPDYGVREEPIKTKTNWEKYQGMLKISEKYRSYLNETENISFVKETLTKVKDMYDDDVKPLQSELFAMRAMGIPLEGDILLDNGYRFCADNFNQMDNLSNDDYQGYVDKFPEFKKKMDQLMKKYNYEYPEKSGTIPKSYERKEGKYTLIEESGGQMCDDPECTMVGHCIMDIRPEYSYYYGMLPIYTRNKEHELCSLCISK
tara:strand:+ start:931 stop:1710 length:780 start_codon:yes stop_codon:yes gene_type:complete